MNSFSLANCRWFTKFIKTFSPPNFSAKRYGYFWGNFPTSVVYHMCIYFICATSFYCKIQNAKQKHLWYKKGKANQKQQLSDYVHRKMPSVIRKTTKWNRLTIFFTETLFFCQAKCHFGKSASDLFHFSDWSLALL